MDDDRINQEKHNCKSEKKGIKLFVLSLDVYKRQATPFTLKL